MSIRVVRPEDAEVLATLVLRNRESLAPWEPLRPGSFFTLAGQRHALEAALHVHATGGSYAGLILVDGEPAGRINLQNIVHGAAQHTDLGYWVDVEHQGRGVATTAVALVLAVAFDELGLHRVQAGTLLHNHASRRVLAKNGFSEIGVAERAIHIAGRWQDHLLHQRLADA